MSTTYALISQYLVPLSPRISRKSGVEIVYFGVSWRLFGYFLTGTVGPVDVI